MSKIAKETVYSVLLRKGLKDNYAIVRFLNGKTVEILNTIGSHNYGGVGTKFTIDIQSGYEACSSTSGNYLNGPGGNSISFKYLAFVAQTVEELTNELTSIDTQIQEAKEQQAEIKAKIKFMKENGLKEFDDTDFKVYAVLKVLEKGASTLDMAKAISALIKG